MKKLILFFLLQAFSIYGLQSWTIWLTNEDPDYTLVAKFKTPDHGFGGPHVLAERTVILTSQSKSSFPVVKENNGQGTIKCYFYDNNNKQVAERIYKVSKTKKSITASLDKPDAMDVD